MEPDKAQQPGQTVTPTNSSPQNPAETPAAPTASPPPDTPDIPYTPDEAEAPEDGDASAPDPQAITWTASEFIAHAKSFGWYAALFAAAAAFSGLVFLVSKDWVSVGVVMVAALLLGIYAGHQPRQLEYRLDNRGLSIGKKHFGYNEFRSFSVLSEGAFSSIVFAPLRRFAVPTTIYYAPEDEDRIVSLLSDHIPLEERGHDAVDRLMHRIRY